MKPLVLPVLACALFVAVGCGPMQVPIPLRLDPETQKVIDDGWNRAFTPPDKLGHRDLLDVMVGTQAYQLGVDTFMFRAEKRFTGGKVVMEVAFDRAKPSDDRFEVSVHDTTGKLLRKERYTRDEINETYRALFIDKGVQETPARRAEHNARWAEIRGLFPEVKDGEPDAESKPLARD
jgi:hypothetical protein